LAEIQGASGASDQWSVLSGAIANLDASLEGAEHCEVIKTAYFAAVLLMMTSLSGQQQAI